MEAVSQCAVKVEEGLESVGKLVEQIGALEGDFEARLRCAGAGQPLCMRVKHDQVVTRDEGWHIRPVIYRIEAQSKTLHGT